MEIHEPVLIWGTIGTLVGAMLSQFTPSFGTELIDAIVQFVMIVGPVVAGLLIARSKVTPLSKTEDV